MVMIDQRILLTRKELVKKVLTADIDFEHEGPTIVNTMNELIVGIFDHVNITSILYIGERFKYIKLILK